MQKINLSWNGLGWEGAKALGDALKANSALEELDIAWVHLVWENTPTAQIFGLSKQMVYDVRFSYNRMQQFFCLKFVIYYVK